MSKTKEIAFAGNLMIVDDQALIINDFKKRFLEKTHQRIYESKVNLYSLEFSDQYLKIVFGSGSAMPRNPKVFNIDTQESSPNPRQSNQVEPKEYFGLIDFNNSYLWLSNTKKKKALLDFICSEFENKQIVVKDVYDQEKFVETLKRLDSIKVSAEPNLFAKTNSLNQELCKEINGYDATLATLSFKYYDKFIGDSLLDKVKSIFNQKDSFKRIVISGRDEQGLGMLFNSDGFSRKINFKTAIDENEMYLSNEVFSRLINKIENEKI